MTAISAALAIEPRPYQREALEAVRSAESRGIRRMLIVLPTGTGKTIVFAMVARERGGRTLILVHRDELVRQAVEKLSLVWPGIEIGVVKAERDEHDAHVVVASIQTLSRSRRLARVRPDFATIVVDEAHHVRAPSYERVLRAMRAFDPGGPLVLGVTATPERYDRKSLGKIFQEVVYQKSIEEMVLAGYLCDIRALRVQVAAQLDDVRRRGGDYDERELGRVLLDAQAPEAIARAYARYAPDRKGIVFVPSVRMALDTARAMQRVGIEAIAIHGETPIEERRRAIERLRNGMIRAVVNCMVLTEGFDEPSVDAIVVARPTLSRALYIQMIGRGTRVWPGKENCLVLDLVGASEKHDLVTADTVFGVSRETLSREGLVSALARRRREQDFEKILGELVAQPIELLGRKRMHWVYTGESYVLPTIGGRIFVRQSIYSNGRWNVVREWYSGFMEEVLAENLPLEWAMGVAEDALRRDGAVHLADPSARWRRRPATERQLAVLRRWGIDVPSGLTAGQASDLILAGREVARRLARKLERRSVDKETRT